MALWIGGRTDFYMAISFFSSDWANFHPIGRKKYPKSTGGSWGKLLASDI